MASCACPTEHGRTAIDGYDPAARVKALEQVLVEKGYVERAALDVIVETYAHEVGPMNGAKVVARAWIDADFRMRLLEDGTAAAAELGFGGRGGEHLVIVENTPKLHNLIVCTLCSCYPWPLLGLPPVWYKSPPYRSRAVIEPRAVLRDFGVNLPEATAIRVWDSTAETRYLVLPLRPEGSEDLSEDRLASLVTREAMIGTGLALAPAGAAA
ncbi:MAG: nitrile hydratase subunit alpha [Hyphomicrobiales bacterium]|nr:nitrile hydratase subunit alpha [Hyphomicrobiales bacterium]